MLPFGLGQRAKRIEFILPCFKNRVIEKKAGFILTVFYKPELAYSLNLRNKNISDGKSDKYKGGVLLWRVKLNPSFLILIGK